MAQLEAAPLLRRLDLAAEQLLSVRGTLSPRRAGAASGGGSARHRGVLGFQHLPDTVVHHVLSYVPADARARAALVCRAWRDTLADARLWTVLDLSPAGGVAQPVSDATLRGAAALARGGLTVLCFDACGELTQEARLEVVTANAGSLRELSCASMDSSEAKYLNFSQVQELAGAAPQLVSFKVDTFASVSRGTRMLRNDAPFGALQLQCLWVEHHGEDADEESLLAFCAAMSAHTTLKMMQVNDTPLDSPAVIDALSAAALACKLGALLLCQCHLSPASVPALARLVSSGVLWSLFVVNDDTPLLNEAAATQLADAVAESRTLTLLGLCNCRFWDDTEATAVMMRACTGHSFLEELNLCCNDPPDQSAAGAALGALVAANAPLKKLTVSRSSLGDAGLDGLCRGLARNNRLRGLQCWDVGLSKAFARNVLVPAVRANRSLRCLDASHQWDGAPSALLNVEALVVARNAAGA